ncbi:MAG: carboxylating nicotinate-nucleotide diphosphorylase [Pirellulaceae bacterium]
MLHPDQDFYQQTIDEALLDDLSQLVRLAIREDLNRTFDLTTVAIVPSALPAKAHIAARKSGVASGLELISSIIETVDADIRVEIHQQDATSFDAGTRLATLSGEARDVLTCERTILNFLGRLCGIATWTAEHVALLEGLPAKLYDTRKTTPGWRRLEKYATRCGGATNHRSGLYEAVMVKDNHLACHAHRSGQLMRPSEAVNAIREFLREAPDVPTDAIVEIEVDSLEQLEDALPAAPDIVLLDNMSLSQLETSVAMRNKAQPGVQLEASGGVTKTSLRSIAETGVDRISMGALTHSAVNLDLGLDWEIG